MVGEGAVGFMKADRASGACASRLLTWSLRSPCRIPVSVSKSPWRSSFW